ncbi:p60 [Bean yellow disorder virus]|uniref:p60 n=1 Tax=Bean yellow disorder virus TaxID=267970 RepID=B2BZW8_9CLOS|nr:p60 [Bean yellow disorder virus]ABY66967.1 p60 [Bean yellow disorder virus]
MVKLTDSAKLVKCFQLLFKRSDVRDKLSDLSQYMNRNYSTENAEKYRAISSGRPTVFDAQFRKIGNDVHFVTEDDNSIVKLIYIYFHKVEPSLIQKMAYKPGSLFTTEDWLEFLGSWQPYIDKSMNDYLNDNKSLGCTFTEEDIEKAYPNSSRSRLITLYRVCNSQNRLIPIEEFTSGAIKGFDIPVDTKANQIGEGISSNPLFFECLEAFKEYVRLNNSKSGKAKIDVNRKFYDVYFESMVQDKELHNVKDNPLVLAKFIKEFDNLTVNSRGFSDNMNAVKQLDKDFQRFIKAVFMMKTSLDEDTLFMKMPKESVIDILGQPISVSNYLRTSELPAPKSNSSSLPEHIDELVSETLFLYFKKFGITDKGLILDALLFVFGKLTTNKAYWERENVVKFSVDGKKIKFLSSDLNSFIKNSVKRFDPGFNCNNIIRQWANLRGDRAIRLFRLTQFKPGLFSTIPGIVPWMRFDFFKLLSIQGLSRDEETSFRTLRLMTEYRSNKSKTDEGEFLKWISTRC